MLLKKIWYALSFQKTNSEVPNSVVGEINTKIPKEKARTMAVLSYRKFSRQAVELAVMAISQKKEFVVSEGVAYEKYVSIFYNPYTATMPGTNIELGIKKGFSYYWVAAVSDNEARIIIMVRK